MVLVLVAALVVWFLLPPITPPQQGARPGAGGQAPAEGSTDAEHPSVRRRARPLRGRRRGREARGELHRRVGCRVRGGAGGRDGTVVTATEQGLCHGPGTPADRRGPGRPRSADADRAIVQATLEMLADEGYHALSVEAVAAQRRRRQGDDLPPLAGQARARRRRSGDAQRGDARGASGERDDARPGAPADGARLPQGPAVPVRPDHAADDGLPHEPPRALQGLRTTGFSSRAASGSEVVLRDGIERGELRADLDVELAASTLTAPLIMMTMGSVSGRRTAARHGREAHRHRLAGDRQAQRLTAARRRATAAGSTRPRGRRRSSPSSVPLTSQPSRASRARIGGVGLVRRREDRGRRRDVDGRAQQGDADTGPREPREPRRAGRRSPGRRSGSTPAAT